ncbi:MAG: tRNA (adenosine(37)-N6)-dimethylallyltransferase MiaA [Bacteroidales bacterium]|nr:tRNA (adenosine(37)-N6)-dimethylallyltransferase MiaA [Bacteroidales bacterium]
MIITLLGATATGKTNLAVALAFEIDGEIISADSRQVYRGMDMGTGKDLSEFTRNGKSIPYHLIDIVEPGTEYNVFKYQKDFNDVYSKIIGYKKKPILCGGTGLYIEAALRLQSYPEVPEDHKLRDEFGKKNLNELSLILSDLKPLHNTSDSLSLERCIRAIEIEMYKKKNPEEFQSNPRKSLIFGIRFDRKTLRERITNRLEQRLANGMMDETIALIEEFGVSPEKLKYYGLEYKYLTMYYLNEISYDEMVSQLNTAIHQFAKRQETWFRGMELKKNVNIQWIDGHWPESQKLNFIMNKLGNSY